MAQKIYFFSYPLSLVFLHKTSQNKSHIVFKDLPTLVHMTKNAQYPDILVYNF